VGRSQTVRHIHNETFWIRVEIRSPAALVSRSKTGFEEISGDVLEADFWPGMIFGLPVTRT